ncbi:M23 family metallopeptidase [Candidatus Rhodoblastus alkanivorans]|uniref:M23 family metallopeptidase n=1 Tax=Candidatus Rhodoblastus alkanivorans TaxID=2954117 RepID=UPI002351806D|nr:M23 family metallopeptidase [Candidatus Rhodoblastus alkanivorans]
MRGAFSARALKPGLTLHLVSHISSRQIFLPTPLAAGLFGAVPLLLLGCLAIGSYFMFRDDMLASLMRRQANMQFAYEDRIAALRAQIDTLASRQMINQDTFEGKVAELAVRQARLESRSALLASLAAKVDPDMTSVAATRPAAAEASPQIAPQAASGPIQTLEPKPSLAKDDFKPVPEGFDLRRTQGGDAPGPNLSDNSDPASPQQRLHSLAARFDRVERRQIAVLNGLKAPAAAEAEHLREAFEEAGLPVDRMIRHAESLGRSESIGHDESLGHDESGVTRAAMGGPFVPADAPQRGGEFDRAYASLASSIDTMNELRQALPYAPVRQPLPGQLEVTSPFGYRIDPFFGRPALHTGMDFHGAYGEPVHATAAGRVAFAGVAGGYGNMVEIDHGAGLATRYGHLSRIDVRQGQSVKAGEEIGAIGSTGRSTGPHLHYEVRVDGAPVNPSRYIKAGRLLSAGL